MRGLTTLVRRGQVLYAGISDTRLGRRAGDTLAALRGWTTVRGLQIRLHLVDRSASATCCRWRALSICRHPLGAVGRAS